MTTAFAIRTIIEAVIVLLLIFGFINEKKVIQFEDDVVYIVKGLIRIHKKKKAFEKKRAENMHLKKVSSASKHTGNDKKRHAA